MNFFQHSHQYTLMKYFLIIFVGLLRARIFVPQKSTIIDIKIDNNCRYYKSLAADGVGRGMLLDYVVLLVDLSTHLPLEGVDSSGSCLCCFQLIIPSGKRNVGARRCCLSCRSYRLSFCALQSPNALHATQVQELRDQSAQGLLRAVVDIRLQQLGAFRFWHDIIVGYRRWYEA